MPKTSRIRRVAFIFVPLLWTLVGTAVAVDLPRIVVDRLEDDFGDVYAGRKVEKRFDVFNKGKAPLAIEYIETTCGCTKAKALNRKIAPGDKTEVVVSYDTAGLSAGKKTQAVKINTNDPKNSRVSIRLYANIVRDVVLDPQNLISKTPEFHNPVVFSVLVKNNSEKPIILKLAKFSGAVAKAVLHPELPRIEPKSDTRFTVEVTLPEKEKGNIYRGSVFLATNHPLEKELIMRCLVKIAKKR